MKIEQVNGLIKQGGNRCYIDRQGRPFIYEKTRFVPLKYLEITKVVPKTTASLIRVKGSKLSITVPRPPMAGMQWAGILHIRDFPWMLYEYSETKLQDSRKKV